MKNISNRLIVWTIIAALVLLMVSLLPFSREIQWNEILAYCLILITAGGAYELWQWLKKQPGAYRLAFGIGLFGALLIGWANGAIGIIGNENNPANLMYVAVFAAGFIGALLSRFKPRGMSYTLFVTAAVQISIPLIALFIWPAKASWGEAGVIGVFIFNSIFAGFFIVSSLLFRRAAKIKET